MRSRKKWKARYYKERRKVKELEEREQKLKDAVEMLEENEPYISNSFYETFRTTTADGINKAFQTILNLYKEENNEGDKI